MAQPHKSIGSSWGRLSAFNQSRLFHASSQSYKEDLGDREEQDMPAAGIATGGPSKGSSNIKDAGKPAGHFAMCATLLVLAQLLNV